MSGWVFGKNKKCSKCKEIKSLSEFYKDRTRSDGHAHICKPCRTKELKEKRKDKEYVEKQREYWRNWYQKNKDKESKRKREGNIKLRKQVHQVLGSKCVKCGYSNWMALEVDHIYGGGIEEWKELGTQGIWRKIIKLGEKSKEKYQLLCANCNEIKKIKKRESR